MVATAVLVLLPNVFYLVVSPFFLVRRFVGPLVYLLAGIIALVTPWPFAYVAFGAAAAADAFFIVCFMFSMPFETSLQSLRYHAEIDVAASMLYVSFAAYGVGIPIATGWAFNRWRREIRRASLLLPVALTFGVVGLDIAVNGFNPLAKPQFESALSRNGLDGASVASAGKNLLVVMVEGMGAFADAAERDFIERPLRVAAGERFSFSAGTNAHWGSTTGATSRELCGRWATYIEYGDRPEYDCLPRQLAEAGYDTAAYHASYGNLFSRPEWYPAIGFRRLNFREDIERDHPEAAERLCGSVFPGLCDREVGHLVHRDLVDGREPKMVYWLTLNSHLPYAPIQNGPLACRSETPAIPSVMPCELTEIWMDVIEKVAEIASDPRLPPTDILVVGDHNTPMWSREAARHFVEGKVDWYLLRDTRATRGGRT